MCISLECLIISSRQSKPLRKILGGFKFKKITTTMNKLLDFYCKMLYFCKGKPSTLSQLSNWELKGILLLINKYPQGLLNGYDKTLYISAINYILKCRKDCKNHVIVYIETNLANRSLIKADVITKSLLNSMIITEKQYKKKLILH